MSSPTHERIINTFALHLTEHGYAGISLATLATDVGVRKPSLYHHFAGGKPELFHTVAQRFIRALGERIAAAINTPAPLETQLRTLAIACSDEIPAAISMEQRIYDALESVDDRISTPIMQQYADEVLRPAALFFAHLTATGALSGDPDFLLEAFLQLTRSADLGTHPELADPLVKLFLYGASSPTLERTPARTPTAS